MSDTELDVIAFMFILIVGIFIFALAMYIIQSLGYYKLFKLYGGWYEKNAWMAFVPYAQFFINGKFLQEQNGDAEWVKWVLGFYWVASFIPIPILNLVVLLILGIWLVVEWCRYFSKVHAGAGVYILYFLFPIAVPFVLVNHLREHPEYLVNYSYGYNQNYDNGYNPNYNNGYTSNYGNGYNQIYNNEYNQGSNNDMSNQ